MWMECPAAPDVNAQYPNEDNEAAMEGTCNHGYSDFALCNGLDAYDLIGTTTRLQGQRCKTIRQSDGKLIKTKEMETFEYVHTMSEEDAEFLQPGIDWVREQPGTFYGEARVDLSEWLGEGQFGTMDRAVLSDTQFVVSDLKYGRGIPVQAVGNKQLRIYALGAWKAYASHITDRDFPVIIHIDQPRNAAGGGIWRITLGELLDFGEEARAAAERTRQPNPPRIASATGCLWCAGKDDCPEYHEYNLQMLGIDDLEDLDDLDDFTLPDPDRLTPQRLRVILEHRPMITKWLEGVHATLFRNVINGGDGAGLKLVEGRKSPDKWRTGDDAKKALEARLAEKAFTKKLITPTQAGKVIGAKDWKPIQEKHVIIGARKPTLVDVADDRPAIESFENADDFEDLDE
jgi:hypothetical protein